MKFGGRSSPATAEPATPAATGHDRRTLAVSLGDPRGIGPEVAALAAERLRTRADAPHLLFIGPRGTVADEAGDSFLPIGEWHAGGGPAEAGHLAVAAVRRAADLALAGEVAGVVTAPLDKSALHAAGYAWPGHTEMLAEFAGGAPVAMMMCAERTALGGALRVVLATVHVALRDVPGALTTDRLVEQVRITAGSLRREWQIDAPSIALCAFNPHASDQGLFGDEEERVYAPALARLQADGIDARGPFPADTVFVRALRGEFAAVVAPYHDVGMAAFKTAAFGSGVNVTLGLPFVRTSPDHGTALDIAGKGTADASSMLEAISLAAKLVATRAALAR